MKKGSRTSIIHNYDLVKTAIDNSESTSEVLKILGLRCAGGNYNALKQACIEHNLSLPVPDKEFYVKAQARRKKSSKYPNEKIFCINSSYMNRTSLKHRLRNIWTDWKCAHCGIGENWNNKKLVLQLDHINGIFNDNRIENLQLLCPNCHSQTKTFTGKNHKK